jgi:hypothetical protein
MPGNNSNNHWFGRGEAARVREAPGFYSVSGNDRFAINAAVHAPWRGMNANTYLGAYFAAKKHDLLGHARKY